MIVGCTYLKSVKGVIDLAGKRLKDPNIYFHDKKDQKTVSHEIVWLSPPPPPPKKKKKKKKKKKERKKKRATYYCLGDRNSRRKFYVLAN